MASGAGAKCSRPVARIAAVDYARSVALLGMAVYHFTYDLALFGALPPGTATQGAWQELARLVAGSFLFLAGVSLVLAHDQGLRARAFLRRLAVVTLAAAAVSLVTWLMAPEFFVYFGILHAIALSSVIGLVFLRLPAGVTLAAAALVLAVPWLADANGWYLQRPIWLGLAQFPRPAMDFEPVFPWTGVFLAGMGCARLATQYGLWTRLAAWRVSGRGLHRALAWPGQHSLMIYLVHQPVLFGAVYVWANYLRP